MALEQEILLSVKCAGKVAKMWTVKSLWIVINTLVEKCVENVENFKENLKINRSTQNILFHAIVEM